MRKPNSRTKKTFSQVLDSVIAQAYESAEPIVGSNNDIIIGDLLIINDGMCYRVVDKETGQVKHDNIYLIEAAFLIAKYSQLKEFQKVSRILNLESRYAKHHMDVMFHYNSCKNARLNENYAKLDLYQIRYRDSKQSAKNVKIKIRSLCDRILKK